MLCVSIVEGASSHLSHISGCTLNLEYECSKLFTGVVSYSFNLFALINILGFPLDKAVAYAKLRNPFIINDLNMQYHIQDR